MNENNLESNNIIDNDAKKNLLKNGFGFIDTNIYNKMSQKLDELTKDIRTIREELKSSFSENSPHDSEKNDSFKKSD